MNIAEYIISQLVKQGITHVFGYQGGNITYLIDAIGRNEHIKYIQTYNEQGAAFAANSYAQVTENFGVAISSSGPGAINMINGIANAYYDSIPCLFITGNINTATMRKSDKIRQNGFQETDIVQLVQGITKYAVTIFQGENIQEILAEALFVMKQGRPGPVLLDIPHDVQRAALVKKEEKRIIKTKTAAAAENSHLIGEIQEKIQKAFRPVVLVGGGCRSKLAKREIEKLLEQLPMPVVASLCGIDVLDNDHRCYRGMIGDYGLSSANRILQEADFVLVLGSRLDERQRTTDIDQFLSNAEVVHVDIDENELQHIKKDEITVHMTTEQFLTEINKRKLKNENSAEWLLHTEKWFNEKAEEKEVMCGYKVQKKLSSLVGMYSQNSIICVDIGNHQMASAQAVRIAAGSKYLNSGGLGSMGYALPASIGAYYGAPEKRIICITGDGGIMMNVQELQVIAREALPIVVIVVNNKELGMIKSYQNLAFEGRNYGTKWGYEAPDFSMLANAFHMKYYKADEISTIAEKITEPTMIEIEV